MNVVVRASEKPIGRVDGDRGTRNGNLAAGNVDGFDQGVAGIVDRDIAGSLNDVFVERDRQIGRGIDARGVVGRGGGTDDRRRTDCKGSFGCPCRTGQSGVDGLDGPIIGSVLGGQIGNSPTRALLGADLRDAPQTVRAAAGKVGHAGRHVVVAGAGADVEVVGQTVGGSLGIGRGGPTEHLFGGRGARGHVQPGRRGRGRVGGKTVVAVNLGDRVRTVMADEEYIEIAVVVVIAPSHRGHAYAGQGGTDVGEGVAAIVTIDLGDLVPTRIVPREEYVKITVVVVIAPTDRPCPHACPGGTNVGEGVAGVVAIDLDNFVVT